MKASLSLIPAAIAILLGYGIIMFGIAASSLLIIGAGVAVVLLGAIGGDSAQRRKNSRTQEIAELKSRLEEVEQKKDT